MKTDQKLIVNLGKDIQLEIFHKSGMGNLTDLWNSVSRVERKTTSDVSRWIKSKRTQEFLEATSELLGIPVSELTDLRGKGKNTRTWAHINVIVSAMSHISPKVEALIINEFVQNRILEWRDESGNQFIALNSMLAMEARDLLGGKATAAHYKELAMAVRTKIRPSGSGWNSASAAQLSERTRIETQLTAMLRLKVVKDWKHLLHLAKEV